MVLKFIKDQFEQIAEIQQKNQANLDAYLEITQGEFSLDMQLLIARSADKCVTDLEKLEKWKGIQMQTVTLMSQDSLGL